ncbi:hypothetical protein [Actinomadura madurae]|uniref:hypothetical protein n=1 Tax=Actinomadura madurae TaxID=1993 RepID=UPI000941DB8F|nr:hypothetical protein [Actinomadura madurae]
MTADAARTCAETASHLAENKKTDYLLTITEQVAAARHAPITIGCELISTDPFTGTLNAAMDGSSR